MTTIRKPRPTRAVKPATPLMVTVTVTYNIEADKLLTHLNALPDAPTVADKIKQFANDRTMYLYDNILDEEVKPVSITFDEKVYDVRDVNEEPATLALFA